MKWFNPESVVQLQHLESSCQSVIDVAVKDRAVLPNPIATNKVQQRGIADSWMFIHLGRF